jgi:hypothetical protein
LQTSELEEENHENSFVRRPRSSTPWVASNSR